MNLDRAKVKAIHADMKEAMKAVAEKHGVLINTFGKVTYDTDMMNAKFKVTTLGENGQVRNEAEEDFKEYASVYDLKPSDLGKRFTFQGKPYTISGLNTRAKKFPIEAKGRNGTYKFAARDVRQALGRA